MKSPLAETDHPVAALGHVAEVTLGKMIQSSPYEGATLVPYIKAKNVRPDRVEVHDLGEMYATPSERSALSVHGGDIFVIEGGATAGRAAVVLDDPPADAIFQNAVHRVRASAKMDQRFLYYVLAAYPSTGWYEAICSAATFKHLTSEKMAALPVPVPPLETQRQVADMLDAETARVDRLIEKNDQARSLLDRRASETIARAVTEGVRGGALRPSPLDWASDVVEHWRVAPYQYLARIGTGHTPSRSEDAYWQDCDIPWMTTSDVKHLRAGRVETLHETEYQISELGLSNSAAALHPAGTVCLSRTASVGFSAVMGGDMATSQDFFTWTCGPSLDPYYLLYVLRAMKTRGQFDRMMYGSTHKTIYFPDLMQLRGPLPPLPEQREIVEHIRDRTTTLHRAADRIRHVTKLLRTRRRALITAAVTGQSDVATYGGS